MQFGISGFRGDEGRDAGIGVFPFAEEILVSDASLHRLVLQDVGAGEVQLRERQSRAEC
jgi:hypothetical protein